MARSLFAVVVVVAPVAVVAAAAVAVNRYPCVAATCHTMFLHYCCCTLLQAADSVRAPAPDPAPAPGVAAAAVAAVATGGRLCD